MAVDFSFGQVEAICAAMQDIASDKRPAFTSRLKHLMKSGIVDEDPAGGEFRPGRGKAAKFSFSQMMKFVIGVELLQAGTPPALAARLVAGNWSQLRVGILFSLYNEVEKRAAGDPREETYWVLAPEALRDLSSAGEGRFDHYEAFESIYRSADLLAHLTRHEVAGIRGHYRRQLVLNGTAITRAAAFLISGELHIASITDLREDIHQEIKRDEQRLAKAMKEINIKPASQRELSWAQEFIERWEAQIAAVIPKLSPAQVAILTADEGSDVELSEEDVLALRDLNLIDVKHGELVFTELGAEVGDDLRKEARMPDRRARRWARDLERAKEAIHREFTATNTNGSADDGDR